LPNKLAESRREAISNDLTRDPRFATPTLRAQHQDMCVNCWKPNSSNMTPPSC
jgi:hypothetical protein